jgi:pyruvate dehydrogenase E2 component (dihydrolipoamide acetyltransferase)
MPVLEVETDKATFPVEATGNGYLHIGPFRAGDQVPVLTVVGLIGKADEVFRPTVLTAPQIEEASILATNPDRKPVEPGVSLGAENPVGQERRFASPRARRLAGEKLVDLGQVTPTGDAGRRISEKDVLAFINQLPKVTPVAANMAAHLGVDLAGLAGTGARGAVTKADIERIAQEKAAGRQRIPIPSVEPLSEGVVKRVPLSGVRGIIFSRMAESVRTTARVTLTSEVDATRLVKLREQLKESVSADWGFTPGYNDLLALIVAHALHAFPYMNARVSADGDAIEWLAGIHIGVAVDTERGLLVPVVRDVDRKGLRQLGEEFRQKVERARAGRSLPDDLSGGTFTITNLGGYEIDAFTPVINLPEAAILGIGSIQGKAVAFKGKVKVRQMLTLSLVFDHRLNDGAPAARFLQSIKALIENPALLIAYI